jgi:glycosyltransferase involved in cell wall biosynthesis
MNVGILVSRLSREGPVNVIYNLISATEDTSIRYIIFTFRHESLDKSRIDDFKRLNISVICLYDKNIINMIKRLKEEIEKKEIDIVHAHCSRSLFIASFIQVKKIFTVHQNFYYEWQIAFGIFGKILILIENKMIQKWDRIICCAEFLENIVKKYTGKKNIYHILNGSISPNICTFQRNGKQPEKTIITYIYVGSIDKRKRVKKLCDDFVLFSNNNEQLICIGIGPDFSLIQDMKYPNIKLLGFQTNVIEYLFQADYFISMSDSEGLPMAVIEALACKLPVVLSDIPAHRDLFSLNEKIGVLIKNDLNTALKKIRNNNYEEMCKEAYNTYSEYLTAEKMARSYIEYYKL